MAQIPETSSLSRKELAEQRGHPEGRWRHWYADIASWMIRNPGGLIKDCAAEFGKHPNYISLIVNTDMFQEYLAQRKQEFFQDHDIAIRKRLTGVAEESLDILLEQLKRKEDKMHPQLVLKIAEGALDRLGYAPATGPQVAVNVHNDNRQQTVKVQGISASELEEARMALRLHEQRSSGQSRLPQPPSHDEVEALEAEPADAVGEDNVVEEARAPLLDQS